MPFCVSCGKEVGEGVALCTECTEKPRRRREKAGAEWGLGLFVGIVGSLVMIGAGISMASIRSAGERTIMEAYYNYMGWGFIGLGILGMMLLCFMFGNRRRP